MWLERPEAEGSQRRGEELPAVSRSGREADVAVAVHHPLGDIDGLAGG